MHKRKTNKRKSKSSGCCSKQRPTTAKQIFADLFGERDIKRRPYKSPPAAFENDFIYYGTGDLCHG